MQQIFVLSPHLDDAAFSCGGTIATATRRGRRVTVVTTFAGDAPPAPSRLAQRLHRSWGLRRDVVARRRDEDRTALRFLGAEIVHWDLPEAIYRVDPRTGEPRYRELSDLFKPPYPEDAEVLQQLVGRISGLSSEAALLVPLAVGGHVDHQLVRQAAEHARDGTRIYFEDYPYSAKPRNVERAIGARGDWRTLITNLDEAARRAKYAAAVSYRSQIRSQFRTRFHLRWRLGRQYRRLGGERFWIPDSGAGVGTDHSIFPSTGERPTHS